MSLQGMRDRCCWLLDGIPGVLDENILQAAVAEHELAEVGNVKVVG